MAHASATCTVCLQSRVDVTGKCSGRSDQLMSCTPLLAPRGVIKNTINVLRSVLGYKGTLRILYVPNSYNALIIKPTTCKRFNIKFQLVQKY